MSTIAHESRGIPGPGAVIAGRYEVESVIGSGGMSLVVAARHRALDRRVAIKFLRPEIASDGIAVARFLREGWALSGLESEHAVAVLDLARLDDGTPYMVMEHLVGIDLGSMIEARGALPITEAADYVLQACDAIAEAHRRGIVHRDLKPSNIFFTRSADGSPLIKVLDFGVCKGNDGARSAMVAESELDPYQSLTAIGDILGSPLYMSPEQILNTKSADRRTDIWALGVILHELLTGEMPFQPQGGWYFSRILSGAPARLRDHRPDAPAELEDLILRCLEKDVDRRITDIAALSRALRPFASPILQFRPQMGYGSVMAQSGHWTTTAAEIDPPDLALEPAIPCLVLIFSKGEAACEPIRLDREPITIGRAKGTGVFVIDDERASRRHTQVALVPEGVRVTDLDSRNGTFVDGARVRDQVFATMPRILRVGHTLLRFAPRIDPFIGCQVQRVNGAVVGPVLQESRQKIARAAASGGSVLLTGPSGSGKELAARVFHAVIGRSGPFIAVNCAAIPAGLAERLLFGARRGAFSGADADADGYVQAADGGTLFLDEIGDLDPSVQPKLLRVLESGEVLALGAARSRPVNLRVCAATLKDLRSEVAAGRFREDLYFRIGRPEVRLPGLAERLEELPWLACAELERADGRLTPSALLLESCAIRPWPGNVRELLLELGQAARAALDGGRTVVEPKDLSPSAGQAIASTEQQISTTSGLSRDVIEAALRREQGNVTGAARALGVHRNQLRRWIAANGLSPGATDPPESRTDPPSSEDKTR